MEVDSAEIALEPDQFWKLLPRGIPVEALFGSQGGSGEVGRRLRSYDANGNGFLDKEEFRNAVRQELSSEAQNRLMKKVMAAVVVICTLLLLAIFGLSFAVMELTKQVEVNKADPVMRVAGSNEAVQVASADLKVVKGNLVPRDDVNAKVSMSSEDGAVVEDAQTASATGNKLTVVAEERTYTARLASCMSNAHFASMKSFEVNGGLMSLRVDVLGYARVARKASLYGTVVILITPIGRITIDGESMSFSKDVGDVFAEAGFKTAGEGRRLLSLYELIALFNKIPAEKYGCFEESVDGPKPSFPMLATARVRKMETCTNVYDEYKMMCDESDPTLVNENGHYYARASGWVYMDVENQRIREETIFDSRDKEYKLVVIQDSKRLMKHTFMLPTAETAKRLGTKPTFFAGAASTIKEKQTETYADNKGLLPQIGFWCADRDLNRTVQEEKYNLENVQAAYEGTTLLADGVKERRFTIRTGRAGGSLAEKSKSADRLVFVYHDRTAMENAQGLEFLPYKLELYDLDSGILIYSSQFEDWNLNVTSEEMHHDEIFAKPAKCHSGGDSTVGAKHILRSTSLLPGADNEFRKKVQEHNLKRMEDDTILAKDYARYAPDNAFAADVGGRRRRGLSNTTGDGMSDADRRSAVGYSSLAPPPLSPPPRSPPSPPEPYKNSITDVLYTQDVPIGSPYVCCGNRYNEAEKTVTDALSFQFSFPPKRSHNDNPLIDFEMGFSMLNHYATVMSATPDGDQLCYISLSIDLTGSKSIIVTPTPLVKIGVSGSLSIDWTPDRDVRGDVKGYEGCFGASGCLDITVSAGFWVCEVGFTVGFCISGGKTDINGCKNRLFGAASFSLELFIDCIVVSGTLGGTVDAFLYLPNEECSDTSPVQDKQYHIFLEGKMELEVCFAWSCWIVWQSSEWRPMGPPPGTVIHTQTQKATDGETKVQEGVPPAPPPPPPPPLFKECIKAQCEENDYCDICASKCEPEACDLCKQMTQCGNCKDAYGTNCGTGLAELAHCKASDCDSNTICRLCRDSGDELACFKCSMMLCGDAGGSTACSCKLAESTYIDITNANNQEFVNCNFRHIFEPQQMLTEDAQIKEILDSCLDPDKSKDCFDCYVSCNSNACLKCQERDRCEKICGANDMSITGGIMESGSSSPSLPTSSTTAAELLDWTPFKNGVIEGTLAGNLRKAQCASGEEKMYCCIGYEKPFTPTLSIEHMNNDEVYCAKKLFEKTRGYKMNDTYAPLFDRKYNLVDCYVEHELLSTKYDRSAHKLDNVFYDFSRVSKEGLPGVQVRSIGQPIHLIHYLTEDDHGYDIKIMEKLFERIDKRLLNTKSSANLKGTYDPSDPKYSLDARQKWGLSDYADFFAQHVRDQGVTCYYDTGFVLTSTDIYNDWYYSPAGPGCKGSTNTYYKCLKNTYDTTLHLKSTPKKIYGNMAGRIYCKRQPSENMYMLFKSRDVYERNSDLLGYGIIHRREVEGYSQLNEFGGPGKLTDSIQRYIRYCALGPSRPELTKTVQGKIVKSKGDIKSMNDPPVPKMNGHVIYEEDQGGGSCFPSDANVCVKNYAADDMAAVVHEEAPSEEEAPPSSSSWCPSTAGRLVPMSHLRVGDVVMTGSGRWSRVYAFGHHHPTAEDTTTLTITFGDHGGWSSSTLSAKHHTFRCTSMDGMKCTSTEEVIASHLEVGDHIFAYGSDGKEMLAPVIKVVSKTSVGMYTPVTHDDIVVVDGVKHSVYTSHVRVLQPVGYFPARLFDLLMPKTNARMANRALFDEGEVFGSLGYLRWLARDLIGFDV